MQLTPELIRAAIVEADHHYGRAARLLGCSPDTLRARISQLKRDGHGFPKSTARGGTRTDVYEPTPEQIAATCRAIREAKGEILNQEND